MPIFIEMSTQLLKMASLGHAGDAVVSAHDPYKKPLVVDKADPVSCHPAVEKTSHYCSKS